jgi:hypothetical protein
MDVGGTFVYQATSEITQPWCVSSKDESITLWIEEDKIVSVLRHILEDNKITRVYGAGMIPGRYVAHEENARI